MAITPRTILTSAAPATVAVVSLYFFTVIGTAAFSCLTDTEEVDDRVVVDEISSDSVLERSTSCDPLIERMSGEPDQWSELSWIRITKCFEHQDQSQLAIDAADQGLDYHPDSEALYNLKGYHQIMLDRHAEAIETLEDGRKSVTHHRNGVMANNLAWAGLWEPRKMQLEDARDLYIESLARSPETCETLHTGLFVEFALANQADGIDQFEPRKRFSDLRNRYNRCLDRLGDGDRKTVVEIIGAAVLFEQVDNAHDNIHPLMHSTTSVLVDDYEEESIDELCEDAMPLAGFHHECVESVERSLQVHERLARQHEERKERADQKKHEIRIIHHNGNIETNESGCGGMVVD